MENPMSDSILKALCFCGILQDLIEELSYLLRIPQRKPYGSMAKNTKEALEVCQPMHECTKMHCPVAQNPDACLFILGCPRLCAD
jgi:hypothetical protein